MALPNFPNTGREAGSVEGSRMYWIPEVQPSPSCVGSAVEACGFACVQRAGGGGLPGSLKLSVSPDP